MYLADGVCSSVPPARALINQLVSTCGQGLGPIPSRSHTSVCKMRSVSLWQPGLRDQRFGLEPG